MVTCSCCGEERDEWDVRPLSCRDDIQICRGCVGGLRYRLAVPDSTPIFPVSDVAASCAFYESLGFDARRYEGGGFAFVEYQDESVFDLDENLEMDPATNPGAGCFLMVHNVDAWHAELSAKGLPVGPLEDMPWAIREFRITDPDGNYVRVGRSLTV